MKSNRLGLAGLILPAVVLCSCDGGDGGLGSVDEPGSGADPDAACGLEAIDPGTGDHRCRCSGLMFWTEGAVVRSASLDGTGVTTVFTGSVPLGVALDTVARKVYWADNGTDTIHRASYDGSAVELLYSNPDRYSNPTGLAVDHQHGRMFWTESRVVRSSKLDGTGAATIVMGDYPTSVAVDSIAQKVYWADNGTDTIHRANYDGSGAQLLYSNSDAYSNPRGLALDHQRQRMFWTESNVLRSARLDGTGAATVVTGSFPTDVAVDPVTPRVYWADNGTDTVHRANYDGSAAELLYTNADRFSNPRGTAVWIEKCSPGGP